MNLVNLRKQLPDVKTRGKVFPEQRTGEEVLLIIRKHWIVDLKVFIKFLLITGIPFVAIISLKYRTDILDGIWGEMALLAFSLYLLFTLLHCYILWIGENLDLVIFTTERVIDVNQSGLFDREYAETDLSEVQDARAQVAGILGTLLNYGTVNIQTAAEQAFFSMKYVHSAAKTVDYLLTIREWEIENSARRLQNNH